FEPVVTITLPGFEPAVFKVYADKVVPAVNVKFPELEAPVATAPVDIVDPAVSATVPPLEEPAALTSPVVIKVEAVAVMLLALQKKHEVDELSIPVLIYEFADVMAMLPELPEDVTKDWAEMLPFADRVILLFAPLVVLMF